MLLAILVIGFLTADCRLNAFLYLCCYFGASYAVSSQLVNGVGRDSVEYLDEMLEIKGDIVYCSPFVPRFDMLHQIAILLHECVCLKGKMTILLDANHFSADNI